MLVVRWAWVAFLTATTLVFVALAPATGLGTLGLALVTAGLGMWLARGTDQPPRRAAVWLVGVGVLGTIALFAIGPIVSALGLTAG